ncbi:MAG: ATP synthase subunit I [Gammaproteobacteria bacterium]|nr:ATP synthase subunit I [Gammaproteobacteria bacterium]
MTLMQVLFTYVYPALVGVVLGFFYYGVLWLSLRRLTHRSYTAAWFGLSLLLRTITVVFVLYLLFADAWQQLLIALLGMLVSRALLVQHIKPGSRHANAHTGQVP